MKLRLIIMGCIISALGAILLIVRGFSAALLGVLIVGIILLVAGLFWRSAEERKRPQ